MSAHASDSIVIRGWGRLAAALVILSTPAIAADPGLIRERTIPLGDVAGRIDHLAVDIEGKRLFVAELGNGSVGVVDLAAGALAGRIGGLAEPQGIAFDPASGRLFVAEGGSGRLLAFDGASLESAGEIAIGPDADNVHLSPDGSRIAVGFADGLALVDPATLRLEASIPLAGHAEGFAFAPAGDRIFVNVPATGEIAVVDLGSARVVATWPTAARGANFPMAMAGDDILAGFRDPPALGRFGSDGKRLAIGATCDDSDDLFADSGRGVIYVVCGAGEVDILRSEGGGFETLAQVPTVPGARTGLFVPALDRLYVAVRAAAGEPASIEVFAPD